jgi:hypothetical protein
VERDLINIRLKNVLIQLTIFNKDRHMSKSLTLKKSAKLRAPKTKLKGALW